MKFFKKLFSSKSKETRSKEKINLSSIQTKEHFETRYEEDEIDASMLEGCLKMIDSYFLGNNIEKKVREPINHPVNLDQTVEDGMGFQIYCAAFKMEENAAAMFLTLAFSDFMAKNLGFRLYKDLTPEYPLRTMTLKYDKNGIVLSLYPLEYTMKVLNDEAKFEDLYNKVKTHLEHLPNVDDVLDNLKNS